MSLVGTNKREEGIIPCFSINAFRLQPKSHSKGQGPYLLTISYAKESQPQERMSVI